MAAEDNLSRELFFDVHRGIAANPKEIDQKHSVGMHWSADKSTARAFAIDNTIRGRTKPIVLHGQVPISSVETDPSTLWDHRVIGELEKEVPVGSGKKMLITGRTTFRPLGTSLNERHNYPKSRKRTYNPPREATA